MVVNSSKKYIVNVLATGIFILLTVSLLLFWIRWVPQAIFLSSIEKELQIELSPSGLVSAELESDPNTKTTSQISVKAYDLISSTCGVFADMGTDWRERRLGASSIYGTEVGESGTWYLTYFDKELGLFVLCELIYKRRGAEADWNKKILLYAGPDGISVNPDKSTGKFIKPLSSATRESAKNLSLYDQTLRRMFVIDFKQEIVKKGPEIKREHLQPIRYGQLKKNDYVLNLKWSSPKVQFDKEYIFRATGKRDLSPDDPRWLKPINDMTADDDFSYLLMDKFGEIYEPDFETLQIKGHAGFLPTAGPPFPNVIDVHAPGDLLAYRVLQFFNFGSYKAVHKGVIAASLSREGMELNLAVFDENGKLVRKTSSGITDSTPGYIAWMISKYLLENLQPSICGIASYVTANIFEASSGHKIL